MIFLQSSEVLWQSPSATWARSCRVNRGACGRVGLRPQARSGRALRDLVLNLAACGDVFHDELDEVGVPVTHLCFVTGLK